jgi:hypothetical protein
MNSHDSSQKNHYKNLTNNNLLFFTCAFFSAFIYFFYRGNNIIFNQILSTFQLDCFFCKDLIAFEFPLQDWIVYSLPGGIWVFVLSIILQNNHIRILNQRIPLDYLTIVYGIGLEVLQFFHWTDGTFDWIDILFIFLGFILSILVSKNSVPAPFYWRFSRQNLLILFGFAVLLLSDVY